jgi:hypothetical protein
MLPTSQDIEVRSQGTVQSGILNTPSREGTFNLYDAVNYQ